MNVSVLVPTYSMERYPDFCECVDSLLSQTYDDVEIVLIIDGNDEVYRRVEEDYGNHENVVTFCNRENAGPIVRSNMGFVLASGDIVAQIDDDAVPREDWIERLVEIYERENAIAVGGHIEPEWVAGKPKFLPAEYYFLIGATHEGFGDEPGERRNAFGSNLSFRRDVYMELGGMKLNGLSSSRLQGRETELCARMREEYGKGVWYTPDAVVSHKIYDYRTEKVWLAKRAFWQGVSKRGMERYVPGSADDESKFLRYLLVRSIPRRLLPSLTSKTEAKQLCTLLVLTGLVGLGYLYGILKWG